MDIKKKLGNKIRELRIKRSLTQEMLAEKINLSPKSLSQIELGNNFVSAETLDSICIALEINPKSLFDFEELEIKKEDYLDEINIKLKHNPQLLKTIYKIINVLDD
ncbi:MAG: helix-turn-helix transcriptional regulator [Candidatus Gastranaerophilales bacterium]|nr:helix-turn-helix transcriptional regulator [Candidatus Gastranaerophilales bacterium]